MLFRLLWEGTLRGLTTVPVLARTLCPVHGSRSLVQTPELDLPAGESSLSCIDLVRLVL